MPQQTLRLHIAAANMCHSCVPNRCQASQPIGMNIDCEATALFSSALIVCFLPPPGNSAYISDRHAQSLVVRSVRSGLPNEDRQPRATPGLRYLSLKRCTVPHAMIVHNAAARYDDIRYGNTACLADILSLLQCCP